MLTINELTYPIVSVHFTGTTTLEEMQTYLSHFADWLSRNTPFGIIVHRSNILDADASQAKEVHQLTVKWAKQNKPQITESCVGMVLVIESSEVLGNQEAMALKGIKAIFGCPGQLFETHTEAELWIQQQIQTKLDFC